MILSSCYKKGLLSLSELEQGPTSASYSYVELLLKSSLEHSGFHYEYLEAYNLPAVT